MSRSNDVSASEGRATPRLLVALAALAAGTGLHARPAFCQGPPGSPSAIGRNAAARAAFQDDKFGLFIHWGVYSLLGKGEWVMDRDKLPISEYKKLPPRFHPTRFDAEAWVKLAKTAGARYITITSKHHDGFCMFDSKLTDYDVVDTTPYHADPMRALADACHRQKIRLFFYYSLLDWHHPDYFPVGKTGRSSGTKPGGIGVGTLLITRARCASSARTTGSWAGSGSTAGGTVPKPTGILPEHTG